MAGPSDGSNSAWRLDDLKELEQTLNYDIASGFSDLEITGLTKEVGAYNMRWVGDVRFHRSWKGCWVEFGRGYGGVRSL